LAVTTGTLNTLIGGNAGDSLTDGDQNTYIGYNAGSSDDLGNKNVAVGSGALSTLNYAGATDGLNVAVGLNALGLQTTAVQNTALGNSAGGAITTGSYNVCIGNAAANHDTPLTTGSPNILIGAYSDTSSGSSTHQIVMGYNVTGNADNSFCFGNTGTDSAIAFGATSISAPSDIRLKEDIKDETVGLEFINELRPVTFRWKKAKDVPSEMKAHSDSEERVMNGKYNHGFIAQEVKSVIDKYDIKDGFEMWKEDEADGRQRIAEGELIPFLVKAIQELSAEVNKLKGE
jgi:trimeric autotransporter adhesin